MTRHHGKDDRMEELLALTNFGRDNLPNVGVLPEAAVSQAQVLVPDAVERAQSVMAENYLTYVQRIDPQINAELDKLAALQARHKARIEEKYEQLSFFGAERKRDQEERHVDELFDEFEKFVTETMEIPDGGSHPYIRVIAAFTGVRA